jgi:hypothetical protein
MAIKKKKSKLSKDDKQIIWIFVIIGIIFASFLTPYFYFQSLKKFEFAGLDWVKTEEGIVTFYSTQVPKVYKGEIKGYHNLYLRNDPRKNSIPAELNISVYPKVKISQSVQVLQCKNSILVSTGLAQMTGLFPFVKDVEGAISNQKDAQDNNLPFANCSSESETTVFLVDLANESSITQEGPDCYKINIGSCDENVLVYERFVIEILNKLGFQKK